VIRLLLRLLGFEVDGVDRPAMGDVDSLLMCSTWSDGAQG
jgi:hypothetical protein